MQRSHSLGIISHLDPTLADVVALSLLLDGAEVFSCSFAGLRNENDGEEPVINFRQYVLDGEGLYAQALMADDCITCALREAIVQFTVARIHAAENDAQDDAPSSETFVILPQGIELAHLMPALSEELADEGVRIMGVLQLLHLDRGSEELLHHIPLAERGLALFDSDDRCIAEVQQLNLGYCDAVMAIGGDGATRELVEHLRPHDVLLFDQLNSDILTEIRRLTHSPVESLARVHPATTQAWGGPCECGTWTLDLYSERPFHPERLKALVSELCVDDVVARGCFWLPTRPHSICSWEGVGGVLSIGVAGKWSELASEGGGSVAPYCHLILTGTGGSAVSSRIENAFARILIGADEDLLAWVGADDGLGDWFE